MTLPRVVLALTGLAFMGFGLAFTFWPGPMAAMVEIGLPTATAQVDFAATYGGFELGFGAFLLITALRPLWTGAGLLAGGLALGGFAVVRLGSLVVSSSPVRPAIYVALGLEVTGMLLNLWGLRMAQRLSRSAG
jgi:hypothetical protein